MRRIGLVVLLALATLPLSACGGGSESGNALSETASKLGEIRSGTLTMRVLVEATGEHESRAGFELHGPFALADEGKLPQADMEYRRIAGSRESTAGFVSTGKQVFVTAGGQTYELPESMVADLRGRSGGSAGTSGLQELDIGDWMADPRVSDGGKVGGAETDRVSARLDVVAAVNDLLDLVRSIGAADLGRLEGDGAEQLRRAVESSSVDVWTGKDDRLLRKLEMRADFAAAGPPELEQALGQLGGAGVTFLLEIDDPNEPVRVEAPHDAVPYPG